MNGTFIVSPGLDLGTITAAHERGVPIMPGALTPTEVITAWKAGADMVKIFPASAVGGPKYLKALKGPLPDVKMLLQVHDELVFEVPLGQEEAAAAVVREVMAKAAEPALTLDVPLDVEVGWGEHWGAAH